MHFRSIVLLLSLLGVAAACDSSLSPGPRVDLVSSTRYNTIDRRLTRTADTLAVKMYAQAQGSPLHRLTISAEYVPVPEPIIYNDQFEVDDPPRRTLVYLDSTLAPGSDSLALVHVLSSRTTSGLEVWRYSATDEENRTGSRSFRLRYARPDTLLNYHNYTVPMQAPGAFGRRSFLALREGLVFPKFSVHSLAQNQALIDLVYLPNPTTGAPTLVTPLDATLGLKWSTRRATVIRRTSLNSTTFGNTTDFTTTFNQGTDFTPLTSTGPLTKGQVIAFQTPAPNSRYGIILVEDILTTGSRAVVLQVRVAK
ncbi:hypothetical protein [Hymenobacter sp. DG01]|uniref:hypothetical protein n=1 Tax=Hymenobacter sp. DG01 TaxID=2584940 RepID=UPI00111F4393|nr:hypothetical protein [Hymenobacter sp. DG01]